MSLTYINTNYIRSYGGNSVSGSIDMRGNTLYNVSDPANRQDVATKQYVDTASKASLLETEDIWLLEKFQWEVDD